MSEVETADDGAQVAPVENAAEEQQTERNASESTTEQVDTQGQDDKPRDEKGRFVPQERVNEITRARREAERRADALERELSQIRQQQPAQHQPQSNEPPPSLENYANVAEWSQALTQYAVRQAEQAAEQRFKQQDWQRQQQQVQQNFAERAAKYTAEHPDFTDAVSELDRSVTFAPEIVDAIGNSEHGPALVHYLAKHLDEADRISRLPAHIAAVQLGRLEAQVSAPKPKPVTKAPTPTPSLGGGSSIPTGPNDKQTIEEWLAERRKQL